MGNNNTFLQNDRNTNGGIIWPKEARKGMDDIATKNLVKIILESGPPESRHNFVGYSQVERSKTECLLSIKNYRQNANRKYSPTQQIFLDNVILPAANEINTRIQQNQIVTKISDDIGRKEATIQKTSSKSPPIETISKFQRVPNGSSRTLTPNVAALIVENDGSNYSKKYPMIFKYSGTGKEVFLCGSFNNWQKLKMVKSISTDDFIAIIDLNEGMSKNI